jgi:hypothetical protein
MTSHAPDPPDLAQSPACSSEPTDASEPRWEKLFEVTARADLFGSHTGGPIHKSQEQLGPGLDFKGHFGGVSKRSAGARGGEVYKVVTTLKASGEGASPPVHVGPMFLDPTDNVLFYSAVIPVADTEDEQPIEVEATAPPGTVAVRLRIIGGWAEGADSSKFVYSYGAASLFRKSL